MKLTMLVSLFGLIFTFFIWEGQQPVFAFVFSLLFVYSGLTLIREKVR